MEIGLKEGDYIPAFALPDTATGRDVAYSSLLRKRQIIIILPGGQACSPGWQWLADAAGPYEKALRERDVTVLAVTRERKLSGRLPQNFYILQDEKKTVLHRLGNAPAFYLIGKDTKIQWVTRAFPSLAELFRRIDASSPPP